METHQAKPLTAVHAYVQLPPTAHSTSSRNTDLFSSALLTRSAGTPGMELVSQISSDGQLRLVR